MARSETAALPIYPGTRRVLSIDIIRGFIMVIMALDHVRDFFHVTAFTADPLSPQTTSAFLFFTRWITHFCAPSFLLLSGISSNLSGQRQSLTGKATFLIKRGIWLIVAEVVLITLALSFDPTYKFIFLQVIWALGWSMILLGLFIRVLSVRGIVVVGLLLVFGHNVFDLIQLNTNTLSGIAGTIFFTSPGTFYPLENGPTIGVLYAILPWSGIMFIGYGLGDLYRNGFPAQKRKKILLFSGITIVLVFVILRYINGYGDPSKWTSQATAWRTMLSFLNTSKYPPSLLYSLMTLGPVLIMLSLADQCAYKLGDFFTIYGKVPFFYFVIHFYLIHFASAVVVLLSGFTWAQATAPDLFFKFRPANFGFELPWVYLIWIAVVAAMYFPSRWFGNYKAKHNMWWLRYL